MSETEAAIRRYFEVVGDLSSSEEDLRSCLAPDAQFRELPNPISPNGHLRDVEQTVVGFLTGKSTLSAQSIEIEEVLVDGPRAAVRSTWRGRIGETDFVAHMAGFLTVRGGLIASHDTFDCYEPFPR
ncbi:hypothetical protein GCM10009808_12120 [Microbacterium sediminicola]|uniref:SnoaL-like domain-containing protein n=1 Tax=Microbacterium sediminicola TaxID=415210 RepID=A0ABN2I0C2_9MICO